MYSFMYNNKNVYFNVYGDLIANSWKNNKFYEIKLLEKLNL